MRSAIRNSRRCGRIMAWSAAALLPALAGCHEYSGGMAEVPLDGEELPILRQVAGTHSHETRAMVPRRDLPRRRSDSTVRAPAS